MYKELLNLKKLPFENVPDPDFFFDSGDYARIHENITTSIEAGRGLMVVTGPVGSGKTTLSQMVMKEYDDSLNIIWMAEPPEDSIDILSFLGRELGISSIEENRVFLVDMIRTALSDSKKRCFLIMDEAHLMSDEVASTLKTLNNLELMSKKFIQILLLGQEELIDFINKPEMEAFKQRIASLEVLGRMQRNETKAYIQYRLDKAGGGPDIFTDAALQAIASGSGGVPRLINTLCDKALSYAASKDSKTADVEDVYDAAQGLTDRKEIFQMMLSVKKNNDGDIESPSSTRTEKNTDAVKDAVPEVKYVNKPGEYTERQQQSLSPLQTMFASPGEFDTWMRTENKKKGLTRPLFHLLLSSIALAASIYYFRQNSVPGIDQIFQWNPFSR